MTGYPEDWAFCRLADAVEINSSVSGTIPTEFKYIDLESVKKGRLIKQSIYKIEDAPSRAQRRFQKGDVLFQTVRPYQCNNLLVDFEPGEFVASTGYAILHEKENVSCCAFIYHYVLQKTFVDEVLNRCAGTSYPAINPKHLGEIAIALPPLPEQKRIAQVLGDVDKLIENLGQRIEKKKLIKKGAMQELLTGEKRLPGFSGEWESFSLGQIGSFYGGLSGKSAPDFGHGNASYITFMNVLTNTVVRADQVGLVVIAEHEHQNGVRKGDLLFNGSSETPEEVAMCAAVLCEMPDTYLNSFCCGFRMKAAGYDPLFASYYFNSEEGRKFTINYARGLTRYNLAKKAMLKGVLKWPKYDEQCAIAKVFDSMDAEIDNLEKQQAKLKLVKKGMLQDLLTGKVRLKG